jgi:hypothetical protein
MEYCFNYLKTNKALSWSSYPYTGSQNACKYNSTLGLVNTVGYQYVTNNDPRAMIAALSI